MKKVFLLLIIIFVCGCGVNNDSKRLVKLGINDLNITLKSFTIGDNGTEIVVTVTNKGANSQKVGSIEAILYDSNNEIIANISKDINIEINSNNKRDITILSDYKYIDTFDIKYKVYE